MFCYDASPQSCRPGLDTLVLMETTWPLNSSVYKVLWSARVLQCVISQKWLMIISNVFSINTLWYFLYDKCRSWSSASIYFTYPYCFRMDEWYESKYIFCFLTNVKSAKGPRFRTMFNEPSYTIYVTASIFPKFRLMYIIIFRRNVRVVNIALCP